MKKMVHCSGSSGPGIKQNKNEMKKMVHCNGSSGPGVKQKKQKHSKISAVQQFKRAGRKTNKTVKHNSYLCFTFDVGTREIF